MAVVKILSADGLTELAEQEVSETRNLFFGSPSAPAVDNMDVSPTNVFADDKADNAYLWVDGMETVATLPVAEADSGGGQSVTPLLPDSVVSQKFGGVVELDSVLYFRPTAFRVFPSSPSVVFRITWKLDGESTFLPFLRIGTMEVAINGTKLISGTSADNKKITAANYADGSSFSMRLGENLPNSKMIDIVKAYYDSRGAEVNVTRGGNVTINPFANVVTSWSRSVSGVNVVLYITPADLLEGESYFFSCITPDEPPATAEFACIREDDTALNFRRYLEKVSSSLRGGKSRFYARLTFPDAVHSFKTLRVTLTYADSETAGWQRPTEVMLSRSDVLTPYTSEKIETDEQRELLASLDISLTYPFATAIAGDTVLWRSWKLGATNTPAKTVTANYSSSGGTPALAVVKSNTGGNDTSAISVAVNGAAVTGHYLDDKGKPLTGLFFSSRKDLQTSAGFLVKWLFAACARKLTINRPRGGMFGEAQEEQGDSATNYYMFAPPAQALTETVVKMPSVATSRAIVTWRTETKSFNFDIRLFNISFNSYSFLGFHVLVVNLEKVIPATEMVSFAAIQSTGAVASWFSFPSGSAYNAAPNPSSVYLGYMAPYIYTKEGRGINILGFTRTKHNFTNTAIVPGYDGAEMAESVELRADAPCRYVETWVWTTGGESRQSHMRVWVKHNGTKYDYTAYNPDTKHMIVNIIAFQSGFTEPTVHNYGNVRVIGIPDNVTSIRIGYGTTYSVVTEYSWSPTLYYYQLNEN